MTVTKNEERGYWEVLFYYKDYTGKRKQKHKRGFKTKKEAIAWAEQFMIFRSFWELYRDDMSQRLRENTVRSKDYVVELKILPYFGEKKIADITAADIRRWQNDIMKQGYAPTYLKTINNQLSAIFNYAVKHPQKLMAVLN